MKAIKRHRKNKMKVVKDENNEPLKVGNMPIMEEPVLNKKQEQEKINLKKEMWRRRKVRLSLLFTSIMFSMMLLIFSIPVAFAFIPFYLHLCLSFYSFALVYYKKRKEKKMWKAYVAKYGGKMGCAPNEIHPHIQVTHKLLAKQGKPIPL